MHPMYNHIGRSPKRKRKKTQSQLHAERQHAKWLKSMGISSKAPKRVNNTMISVTRSTEEPIKKYEKTITPKWSACVKKPERKTDKTYTVAIAYNKGAYQVISPKDIKDIGK